MTYYTLVFCSERGPFLKLYGKLLFPHLLINVNKGGSLRSCTFFSHPFPLPSDKRKKSCYCCAEKYDLVRRTESSIWMSSWLEKMSNIAVIYCYMQIRFKMVQENECGIFLYSLL